MAAALEDSGVSADDAAEIIESPYFVTIVGKRRFRRLHRTGRCGVSSIEVQSMEPVWVLRGLAYDLACRHCWRCGDATLSEAEEADDSGSAEEP